MLKRRMIIWDGSAGVGSAFSYATTLAESGRGASTNPSGTANAIPISASETFGGGHVGNVQDEPVRPRVVPSGQTRESVRHTTGLAGYSTAFRYMNPPM